MTYDCRSESNVDAVRRCRLRVAMRAVLLQIPSHWWFTVGRWMLLRHRGIMKQVDS
jgi:hypothetical protein